MKKLLVPLLAALAVAAASVSSASAVNDPGQESFGCGGHVEWVCDWQFRDNFWNLDCYEVWVRDC